MAHQLSPRAAEIFAAGQPIREAQADQLSAHIKPSIRHVERAYFLRGLNALDRTFAMQDALAETRLPTSTIQAARDASPANPYSADSVKRVVETARVERRRHRRAA